MARDKFVPGPRGRFTGLLQGRRREGGARPRAAPRNRTAAQFAAQLVWADGQLNLAVVAWAQKTDRRHPTEGPTRIRRRAYRALHGPHIALVALPRAAPEFAPRAN